MADFKTLRLAAILVLVGEVMVSVVVEYLHPAGGATEEVTLANFAASGDWTAIHLGQFVGMALLLAGLLVLIVALNLTTGASRWVGFFSSVSAGAALVLASVLFAVDGVANKQASEAFVHAPAAEKVTRFASAEALRWLEWGVSSYQDILLGTALLLLSIAIVRTARVSRLIGYGMGLSGMAYLALGWVIGTTGFTSATTVPTYAGYGLLCISMIWLLIVALRHKQPAKIAQAAAA